MSTKLGIFLALLALALLCFLCIRTHLPEMMAMQGLNTANTSVSTNANTNANVKLAAPSLKAAFENGKYRLTGTLPDESTKQQVLAKAREIYGEGNFIDELKVGGVSAPSWLSSVLSLFPFTKNSVTNGGLSAEGNSISLIGQVPNQAAKDKTYADAVKAVPSNVTINNLLTISGQTALSEQQAIVQVKLNEAIAGKVVEFETGSDQLTDKGKAVLDALAPILKDSTENLEIAGNTDNQGNAKKNSDLSKRRAETVKKYLIGKDLNGDRFSTKGYGQEKPIADNNTEDGRQRNRRIDFQVLGGK